MSELERIELTLQFLDCFRKANELHKELSPTGFAAMTGSLGEVNSFLQKKNPDDHQALNPSEERFMHNGYMMDFFWDSSEKCDLGSTIHAMRDELLSTSQGVFQVGKNYFPSAINAAFAFTDRWSYASTMNCFKQWHSKRLLCSTNPRQIRYWYTMCRVHISIYKDALEPFNVGQIQAAAKIEFTRIKRSFSQQAVPHKTFTPEELILFEAIKKSQVKMTWDSLESISKLARKTIQKYCGPKSRLRTEGYIQHQAGHGFSMLKPLPEAVRDSAHQIYH